MTVSREDYDIMSQLDAFGLLDSIPQEELTANDIKKIRRVRTMNMASTRYILLVCTLLSAIWMLYVHTFLQSDNAFLLFELTGILAITYIVIAPAQQISSDARKATIEGTVIAFNRSRSVYYPMHSKILWPWDLGTIFLPKGFDLEIQGNTVAIYPLNNLANSTEGPTKEVKRLRHLKIGDHIKMTFVMGEDVILSIQNLGHQKSGA